MPNASNTERVVAALGAGATDVTSERAGRHRRCKAHMRVGCCTRTRPRAAAAIGRFRVGHLRLGGHRVHFVAGTGYTGEDGLEVAVPADRAVDFWEAVMAAGFLPAGLGHLLTPCGSRPRCPCTATNSTPGSHRCRQGSTGW